MEARNLNLMIFLSLGVSELRQSEPKRTLKCVYTNDLLPC